MSVAHMLLLLLAIAIPAHAQDAGIPPSTTVTTSAQEGCAADVTKLCQDATTPADHAQCLQTGQASVSEACQAALAQTPPPGIARHLGFDPQPTVPESQAQPPDPANPNPPQAPAYSSAAETATPPRPARVAPTVILAQPTTGPASITAPGAPNPILQ